MGAVGVRTGGLSKLHATMRFDSRDISVVPETWDLGFHVDFLTQSLGERRRRTRGTQTNLPCG
jgi:hypothetical protein